MRNILGYVLGGLMFVLFVPAIMWFASLMPEFWIDSVWRVAVAVVLAVVGISLSVWSIVYMKRKGDGNPLDAFGHEVAPRTKHLMTSGPYRLSRNPMLTGSFVYYAGVCVLLWTWQALLVFAAVIVIMLVQVRTEEKRLRNDFGDEYEAYCRRTGRFLPF
jgi:protein-S-isoprenylcysteine O-methyltransferase Ste14